MVAPDTGRSPETDLAAGALVSICCDGDDRHAAAACLDHREVAAGTRNAVALAAPGPADAGGSPPNLSKSDLINSPAAEELRVRARTQAAGKWHQGQELGSDSSRGELRARLRRYRKRWPLEMR